MKKKLISLAMLVTVFAMQVVGVSAASKTTTMAATGAAQGKYDVEAMSQSEIADVAKVNQTAADLIKDVNAGTKTLDDIAKAESSIASDLAGESLVTAFMDVTPTNGGVQLADGRYQVTLSVPALTKGMTDVKVLHFSTARNVWEVITPSNVDLNNKELTFEVQDLSPIAIIAKVNASQAVTNTAGTSPKTGVDSTNTVPFAGAAVVLLGAAAVVAFRKKNA